MKKLFVTILAVFYLGVSSGATMHFHHCMGQLVEWGFSSTKLKSFSGCSKCGMKSNDQDGCCKHQTKEAKIDKGQKAAENQFSFKIFATFLRSDFPHFDILQRFSIAEAHPLLHSPPGVISADTYLLVCNFRI